MPAFSRFLRYFLVVGRCGSIRKAADELNVSASAIDRQILNAEAELGMPLFERLPTGLRLTAAGEILMAAGGKWQKSLQEVRTQVDDLRGLKRGHVEIAIIHALTKGTIPAIITAIHQRYPGISVGLRVLDSEPHSIRDLTVRAYAEVHLGFVSRPDHPLARRDSARFSSAADLPMILPAPPLAVHHQVAVLEAATQMPLNKVSTSDNIQMITSMVQAGLGVGVLTSLDVATEVASGQLAFTRITDPILKPLILALCTASSRAPSYAADLVLSEIQQGFGALGYQTAAD
jgi:DNA-binding transcriptional LysR family regulator